jgi:hypothetical protein
LGSWDDIEPEKNGLADDEKDPAPKTTRSHAVRATQEQIDTLTDRLACMTVRRITNQHECRAAAGGCDHIEHPRDADFLENMLSYLGLPGSFPAVTGDDRRNWLDGLKTVSQPMHFNELLGCTAAVILALAVWIFAFGGLSRFTADWRGETDKINNTKGNGVFRQSTYEWFFDQCASIQTAEGSIASAKEELAGKPSTYRTEQLNANLTALRSTRTALITQYNANAAEEHREAFKAKSLPDRLDVTATSTDCAP